MLVCFAASISTVWKQHLAIVVLPRGQSKAGLICRPSGVEQQTSAAHVALSVTRDAAGLCALYTTSTLLHTHGCSVSRTQARCHHHHETGCAPHAILQPRRVLRCRRAT